VTIWPFDPVGVVAFVDYDRATLHVDVYPRWRSWFVRGWGGRKRMAVAIQDEAVKLEYGMRVKP
jgi:hypothetical protein